MPHFPTILTHHMLKNYLHPKKHFEANVAFEMRVKLILTFQLTFVSGDEMTVVRKGDEVEKEWWWSSAKTPSGEGEGYIPRNLLGLYPRVPRQAKQVSQDSDMPPSTDSHVEPMIVSMEGEVNN